MVTAEGNRHCAQVQILDKTACISHSINNQIFFVELWVNSRAD